MAVRLSERSFEFAKKLIDERRVVLDVRDAQQENEFIQEHGFSEYGRWYLGVDDEYAEDNKSRHKFPYGDFKNAYRCGVISAEVQAAQRKYADIEVAAAHLHDMNELMRPTADAGPTPADP